MTDDAPSSSPAILLSDKLMTITNLTTRVLVLLDVDEMNYASWVYFFQKLCGGYKLLDHILGASKDDTTPTTPTPPTDEWLTIDSIVLTWIFTTLSKPLQQRLVVENPETAKEAWDILALIFNDNKQSRSIALKAELRFMKLSELSIDAHFSKIESITIILSSLGLPIGNDDAVNIALDGLPDKYHHVSDIIIHRDPFLDLKTARSMLTTAKMRLKSRAQASYVDSTSSSSMVLLANFGSNTQRSAPSMDKMGQNLVLPGQLGLSGQTGHSGQAGQQGGQLGPHGQTTRQETILPNAFHAMTLQDPTPGNWNMDTCARSHLNDSVSSLSDIFNLSIYPSISIGDKHSIPVTNSGHSILPTPHRPLHLNNVLITPNIVKIIIFVRQFVRDNYCTVEFDAFSFSVKDFLTRRVLLRYDSTGYLYPVINPSTVPHAFLTSQYTWHQRLGHPGSEVLRRVLSSNSISCNKEKPPDC
uniref:Ribonuclease H-like domain-containing protein n=1 Tax=Tanacetum cinerariifolium TaxID=118510 RepID=A0A699HR02_TANCI|nr:ribonuclease H-like domain-containing protein [Tanacetum cinerariifolium]GEY62264.1 ribonuclease H-like domain-containing protein [Tanacetum cinerariifolium]